MVNYLSQFIPNMPKITSPLRVAEKEHTTGLVRRKQIQHVDKLEQVLTNSPVLQYFNPEKPVTTQSDISQSGLGSCLLQKGHPMIYASRSLTNAEQNYAQIEKELLAIVFACEQFHQFVYGNDILVKN